MDLVNPFEEVVVFGKSYPVAEPVPGATPVKALLPTGRHVSHENALTHVHNGKGGGGPATRLERYTGPSHGGRTKLFHQGSRKSGPAKGLEHTRHTSRGFKPGPFKKAFEEVDKGFLGFGGRAARKAQVARGLSMAAGEGPGKPAAARYVGRHRPESVNAQRVSRGLQMAAGQKGTMPLTGRTGTSVIAPTRRDSMWGAKAKAPIGSKYLVTSRGEREAIDNRLGRGRAA